MAYRPPERASRGPVEHEGSFKASFYAAAAACEARAQRHRDAHTLHDLGVAYLLARAVSRALATLAEWAAAKKRLPDLGRRKDDEAIAAVAERFPQYARSYIEDEVLPSWGAASLRGDRTDADVQLHLADAVALALRAYSGDTTLADA